MTTSERETLAEFAARLRQCRGDANWGLAMVPVDDLDRIVALLERLTNLDIWQQACEQRGDIYSLPQWEAARIGVLGKDAPC